MTRHAKRPQGRGSFDRLKTSREIAFEALSEYKASAKFIGVLLDERFQNSSLSSEDRRLATEIASGVVRRKSTLDTLLAPHVQRPRHKVEPELWTLLQIGVYQLALLSSVPPHAAVSETVELARRIGKARWVGFANAILRRVQSMLTKEFLDAPTASALPLSLGRYRKLDRDIFPNPSDKPNHYIAHAFGFPLWLIERWSHRVSFDELIGMAFWFNSAGQITLRVNPLRITREKLVEELLAAGVETALTEMNEGLRLLSPARVPELPGYDDGWFVVQDESAIRAVDLLAPQPSESVLDLCAAPGTKTTHIATRMQNSGSILALDTRAERLARVEENCRRLGINIVQTQLIDEAGDGVAALPQFDGVLVDVPCSNTGVLGKRPEARWRLEESDIAELTELQLRLLLAGCEHTKPGGRIVYSTCSIEPDENQHVVRAALAKLPQMEFVTEIEHHPGRPADGGYQALLRHKTA